MSQLKLSISAAQSVKRFSEETKEKLIQNIKFLDNEVNALFSGLQDPTIKAYLDLSNSMQTTIKSIGQSLEAVEDYCQAVVLWIQNFQNL